MRHNRSRLKVEYGANRWWFISIAQAVYQDISINGQLAHSAIDLQILIDNIVIELKASNKWHRILDKVDPWMLDAEREMLANSIAEYMIRSFNENRYIFKT